MFVKKTRIFKKCLVKSGIVVLGLSAGYGYSSSEHDHNKKMEHSKMDYSKMNIESAKGKSDKRKTLSESSLKELIAVFEVNEKLHENFFKYNATNVEKLSIELKNAIAKVLDLEIANKLKFTQKKLDEIKASKDREENNQSYHLVSLALIHIMNTYDVGDKYNAFSCPMVKKKWIQNSQKMSKVHNPYAEEMPGCGSQDTKY